MYKQRRGEKERKILEKRSRQKKLTKNLQGGSRLVFQNEARLAPIKLERRIPPGAHMKKIISIICLSFLLFSLLPVQANAVLVPCGHKDANPDAVGFQDPYPDTEINEACPCTLCHFFILFKNVVDFVLIRIVPAVAVLMLVIGGIMFFGAGTSPATLEKAKKIITNTILGLLIIFTAWLTINTFMMFIGVQEWTGLQTWWQIDCLVADSGNDSDSNCIVNGSREISQSCYVNLDCATNNCEEGACKP